MTSTPRPYTSRNIRSAAVLLAVLVAHVAYTAYLLAETRANHRAGYEGEAAGLEVALLFLLSIYLGPFAGWMLVAALRRGSKPVAEGILLLGLLLTIGLAFLILVVWLNAVSQ